MTATTCVVVTCRGPVVVLVDDELLRKQTKRYRTNQVAHVLEELRTAAQMSRFLPTHQPSCQ